MIDKEQKEVLEKAKESDTWFISDDAAKQIKYAPKKKLEAAMALAQKIHSDNNKH